MDHVPVQALGRRLVDLGVGQVSLTGDALQAGPLSQGLQPPVVTPVFGPAYPIGSRMGPEGFISMEWTVLPAVPSRSFPSRAIKPGCS